MLVIIWVNKNHIDKLRRGETDINFNISQPIGSVAMQYLQVLVDIDTYTKLADRVYDRTSMQHHQDWGDDDMDD